MEALDRPALMGEAELVAEGSVVERPGEVPLRFAVVTRKGTLADEPAERTRGVAVSAVHTEAAGLPLAPLLLRIEDGDGRPLLVGYTSSQGVRRVHRRYLDRMRTGARTTETGWVRDRAGRRLADLIRNRTPNVLET